MTINQFISQNNIQVGDRIVVPKSAWDMVQHHAIYMGVINGSYTFIENKERIGVRLISASDFFFGVKKVTRIEKFSPSANYNRNDLYNYALSKLGTPYNLEKYNCEHLANELQYRKVKSQQVSNAYGILAVSALLLLFGSGGSK